MLFFPENPSTKKNSGCFGIFFPGIYCFYQKTFPPKKSSSFFFEIQLFSCIRIFSRKTFPRKKSLMFVREFSVNSLMFPGILMHNFFSRGKVRKFGCCGGIGGNEVSRNLSRRKKALPRGPIRTQICVPSIF